MTLKGRPATGGLFYWFHASEGYMQPTGSEETGRTDKQCLQFLLGLLLRQTCVAQVEEDGLKAG